MRCGGNGKEYGGATRICVSRYALSMVMAVPYCAPVALSHWSEMSQLCCPGGHIHRLMRKLFWCCRRLNNLKCYLLRRPWAKKPSMLDASQGVSDGEDNVLMEDDDEGGQALPSRLVKQQRAKKFRWKLEEDRALLQGYIRWLSAPVLSCFQPGCNHSLHRPCCCSTGGNR